MNKNQLKKWLQQDEGLRLKPYLDIVNKTSIGYGRNLSDNGITEEEANYLLDNDINRVEKELLEYQFYIDAPSSVKDALFNMCFNLGLPKLLEFKRMIQCLKEKNYAKASLEIIDSKYYHQVGERARYVVALMKLAK